MALVTIVAFLRLFIPLPAYANSGWYNSSWKYRRSITIDHTKVTDVTTPATTYANFPILVYATGLSNIKADGADIRFTSSDGTTELPREIESYSGGTLYAWVKVTLTKDASDSTDDVIYMYYSNAAATEPAAGSAYGSQNVWDSNYQAVWHMKEDPSGAAPQIKDSTSNVRHGTSRGSMTSGDVVAGKISNSLDFDATDDAIDTSNFMSSGVTQLTAQAWVYKTATKDSRIVFKTNVGNTGAPVFGLCSGGTDLVRARVRISDSTFTDYSVSTITLNTWTFVAFTYDGSNIRVYNDGALVGTVAETGTLVATSDVVVIATNDTGATDRFWPGRIDEVRLSNVARSTEWFSTQYSNQNSPSTFISLSVEQVGDWDSYSDSGHSTQSDNFDDYGTEHTVYMYGTGFAASTTYRVIFWDDVSGTWYNRETEDATSDGSGNLSAAHTFTPSTDTDGTWHVTVYNDTGYSPSTYDANDSKLVADDISYPGDYAFTVAASAIPEFPTIMAAIGVAGLCFGIYYWMRKRRRAYV